MTFFVQSSRVCSTLQCLKGPYVRESDVETSYESLLTRWPRDRISLKLNGVEIMLAFKDEHPHTGFQMKWGIGWGRGVQLKQGLSIERYP